MAIIHNTLNDIKQYIHNNNRADDRDKEKALHALSLLTCPQIIENTAMQAVVGFDGSNVPLFWDMTEGNLLATCWTGLGMNYMGCATVLVSLLLRFTKEEFQYYILQTTWRQIICGKTSIVQAAPVRCLKGKKIVFVLLKSSLTN